VLRAQIEATVERSLARFRLHILAAALIGLALLILFK
jgi:hypothetical protein